MNAAWQIFVSSVQKELEDERLIVQNLVNTEPEIRRFVTSNSWWNWGRLNKKERGAQFGTFGVA